jgi:uncharacterized protein YkwD
VLFAVLAVASLVAPAAAAPTVRGEGHGRGASHSRHACGARAHGAHAAACPQHRRSSTRHHSTAPAHSPRHTPSAPTPSPAATRSTAAATIAAVLATPCEGTEATPEPGDVALVRAAVLCLINRERAQHGEPPLTLNPDLQRAAEEHDQELITVDYFAHVAPSGETPVDRIRATGYVPGPSFGYILGENLAWGTYGLATAQSIVNAWIASPGHLANILEAQYRDTGIAVVPAVPTAVSQGAPGATYAQEFGTLLG